MIGIIVKGIGGFYYVKTADGNVSECKARGKFRKEKVIPMIGDYVEFEDGSIIEIKPRKNSLVRPPVANIDMLVIVAAAKSPDPNFFLIDKMLINAEANNIEPVICVNKTDLDNGAELNNIYSAAGYKVIVVSALENRGIDELKAVIKNKISAFSGLSGVGKSSILNILSDIDAKTGSVSEKIQRGKHTTRHVELFELNGGGYVLDTPGFSSLETNNIKSEDLSGYFPEMRGKESMCRFRGCSHINEPDCAVKAMLKDGTISESRYNSYVELYNTLKQIKDWK